MPTTTDEAKTIRDELKARGVSSRKVSVKSDYYSMGSSINVTIKDPTVSYAMVEEIAKRAERVDRCQITGDILSGGNRFVFVGYSRSAIDIMAAPYMDKVKAACDSIALDDISTCREVVPGCTVNRVHKGCDSFHLRLRATHGVWLFGMHPDGLKDAAAKIARDLLA